MNINDFTQLRAKISDLARELREAENQLRTMEANCPHSWGDPVGTMGVDWRGPMDVPSSTSEKHFRTCRLCGTVQEATRFEETIVRRPTFPS